MGHPAGSILICSLILCVISLRLRYSHLKRSPHKWYFGTKCQFCEKKIVTHLNAPPDNVYLPKSHVAVTCPYCGEKSLMTVADLQLCKVPPASRRRAK